MDKILVIHGPNLNLLGQREPEHYGSATLEEINQNLLEVGKKSQIEVSTFQSNHEGELVDQIQKASAEGIQFIIMNPAAYTHTSVALRDALLGVKIPFIEVHLSNVHQRENFRQHSYFSDIALGVICGFGPLGYKMALTAAIEYLNH